MQVSNCQTLLGPQTSQQALEIESLNQARLVAGARSAFPGVSPQACKLVWLFSRRDTRNFWLVKTYLKPGKFSSLKILLDGPDHPKLTYLNNTGTQILTTL